MSLVERIADFRVARRAFLNHYMPPQGTTPSTYGILVRPLHEAAATYEAMFFGPQNYSFKPRVQEGNVTYLL